MFGEEERRRRGKVEISETSRTHLLLLDREVIIIGDLVSRFDVGLCVDDDLLLEKGSERKKKRNEEVSLKPNGKTEDGRKNTRARERKEKNEPLR